MTRYGVGFIKQNGFRSTYDIKVNEKGFTIFSHYLPSGTQEEIEFANNNSNENKFTKNPENNGESNSISIPIDEWYYILKWFHNIYENIEKEISLKENYLNGYFDLRKPLDRL